MPRIPVSSQTINALEHQLEGLQNRANGLGSTPSADTEEVSFSQMLKENIYDVNKAMSQSDRLSQDVVSGKSSHLHETMLAATRAELSFQFLVQMRNRLLEAYQEVMRMQV